MSTRGKHNSRLPNLNDTQFSSKNYLLIWFLCNPQLKESKNLCSAICNKFQAFLMYIWGHKARCWWQYSLKLSFSENKNKTTQQKNPQNLNKQHLAGECQGILFTTVQFHWLAFLAVCKPLPCKRAHQMCKDFYLSPLFSLILHLHPSLEGMIRKGSCYQAFTPLAADSPLPPSRPTLWI